MYSIGRSNPAFLPMTEREHDAFIARQEEDELITYNYNLGMSYTPAQRARAAETARARYLAFVPIRPFVAGDFRAADGYLDAVYGCRK